MPTIDAITWVADRLGAAILARLPLARPFIA
jgi:hypothetical protein